MKKPTNQPETIEGEIINELDIIETGAAVAPYSGRALQPFEVELLQASVKAEMNQATMAFSRWFNSLAGSTGEQYRKGIRAFCAFLSDAHDVDIDQQYFHGWDSSAGSVSDDFRPDGWELVSYGLVMEFRDWLLDSGYAIASVNGFMNAVKQFAKVATEARLMSFETGFRISQISKIKSGAAKNIDSKRIQTRIAERTFERNGRTITRTHNQKSKEIEISGRLAKQLKTQWPADRLGLRNRLMFCLMIDHGLRASEVAGLKVENFNLGTGTLDFYRTKVKRDASIILSKHSLSAARKYLGKAKEAKAAVFIGANRNRELVGQQLNRNQISRIVSTAGKQLASEYNLAELNRLGSHDLRHHWATAEAKAGTPLNVLQHAGGWNSPAMPLRYIARAKYDNEGSDSIKSRKDFIG